MQDLQRQLDALYDLEGFLKTLQGELEYQLTGYRNRTFNLRDMGISNEVASFYESSFFTVNEGYLKQLINNIQEGDLVYVHRQILVIDGAIQAAGGTYQR